MKGWEKSPRGAGYMFGEDIVQAWNHKNGCRTIVRAHQLVMEGYKWMFGSKLVTVWSAPNYCYRCGNLASILNIEEDLSTNFIVFKAVKSDKVPAPPNLEPVEYFL